MKIIAFGDLNIQPYNEFCKASAEPVSALLNRFVDTAKWVRAVIQEQSPDLVVYLGDWFDSQGSVDIMSLLVGNKLMGIIDAGNVEMLKLAGNHDWHSRKVPEDQRVSVLRLWGEDTSIEECTVIERGGLKLGFIPYCSEKTIEKFLASLTGKLDVVFTHIDIVGAYLAHGVNFEGGIHPDKLREYAKLIINGHYHNPSDLGKDVVMVGSPLSRNFKDEPRAIPKGIISILIDEEPTDIARLANPHETPFLTVRLEDKEQVNRWVQGVKQMEGRIDSVYVRMFVKEAFFTDTIKANLDCAKGFRLHLERTSGEVEQRTNITLNMDPLDCTKEYAKIADTDIDRADLTAFGVDRIKEVMGG